MGECGHQPGWARSWGTSFDAAADAYDKTRPGYPARLYGDLQDICALDENTNVLEVGCGTGQATEDIAVLVGNVIALEPGAALAGKARMRLEARRNVEVLDSTFEEYEGRDGDFDLVISATAFHWVEPEIGFAKAARMLKLGGWLALWWNAFENPEKEDPFGDEVSRLISSHGFPGYSGPGYALRTEERISDFDKSPKFGSVLTRRYEWNGEHSAEEIRELFSTYSNVQKMEETERWRILDGIERLANENFGGSVKRPYITALYTAQKTGEAT